MKSEDVDYGAVLADLEAKRTAIDNAIAAIKMLVGPGQSAHTNGHEGDIDLKSIPTDAFFQMSVPDAIRKYLKIAKRPRSVRDITEALENGGITHTSKTFSNNISTALIRGSNKEGGFVKVKNEWGLTEWYPGLKLKIPAKSETGEQVAEDKEDAAEVNTDP